MYNFIIIRQIELLLEPGVHVPESVVYVECFSTTQGIVEGNSMTSYDMLKLYMIRESYIWLEKV